MLRNTPKEIDAILKSLGYYDIKDKAKHRIVRTDLDLGPIFELYTEDDAEDSDPDPLYESPTVYDMLNYLFTENRMTWEN